MRNWKKYWNEYPAKIEEKEFYVQVGKTFHKQPISSIAFNIIINTIVKRLDIELTDNVFDMCCGNGIITLEVSKRCNRITGLDYSQPLINNAIKYNCADNIDYICSDILDPEVTLNYLPFKIYMYEALQHFSVEEFAIVLRKLIASHPSGFQFFIGSVPDVKLKSKFYNTIKRKLEYYIRKVTRKDAIGYWWDKNRIIDICNKYDLKVEFYKQESTLTTAYIRFDMLINYHGGRYRCTKM